MVLNPNIIKLSLSCFSHGFVNIYINQIIYIYLTRIS